MTNINTHSTGYPVATAPEISTALLVRFIIKLFSYLTYTLLVVMDGLNNPESFNSKLLTLPYLIGGLALTRSICEALDHHYDGHAAIFAMGLSTLGALA